MVHGVAGSLNPDSVNSASKNMYKLGFTLSLLMGSLVYYVLCLIWPPPMYPVGVDGPERFEGMADSEGFFEGETPEGIRMLLHGVSPVVVRDGKAADVESTSEKTAVV